MRSTSYISQSDEDTDDSSEDSIVTEIAKFIYAIFNDLKSPNPFKHLLAIIAGVLIAIFNDILSISFLLIGKLFVAALKLIESACILAIVIPLKLLTCQSISAELGTIGANLISGIGTPLVTIPCALYANAYHLTRTLIRTIMHAALIPITLVASPFMLTNYCIRKANFKKIMDQVDTLDTEFARIKIDNKLISSIVDKYESGLKKRSFSFFTRSNSSTELLKILKDPKSTTQVKVQKIQWYFFEKRDENKGREMFCTIANELEPTVKI